MKLLEDPMKALCAAAVKLCISDLRSGKSPRSAKKFLSGMWAGDFRTICSDVLGEDVLLAALHENLRRKKAVAPGQLKDSLGRVCAEVGCSRHQADWYWRTKIIPARGYLLPALPDGRPDTEWTRAEIEEFKRFHAECGKRRGK